MSLEKLEGYLERQLNSTVFMTSVRIEERNGKFLLHVWEEVPGQEYEYNSQTNVSVWEREFDDWKSLLNFIRGGIK